MLSFQPLKLEDKALVDKFVFEENSRSADFNFGNMYMWDEKYRQSICSYGGRLVVLAHGGGSPIFPFPIGTGELKPVVDAMRDYAAGNAFEFVIRGLEEHHKAQLESLYPAGFEFSEDRAYADYIYSIEKLSELKGKKLHGKKNYVNRFMKENDWCFRTMDRTHFTECIELLEMWGSEFPERENNSEKQAILRAFESYEELGLFGGCLFREDRLIAFCIGELISRDCFNVHFEKADVSIPGSYQMINFEFAKAVRSKYFDVSYVNREDDMGIDNLRKAKMSYYPEYLLTKYSARWKT